MITDARIVRYELAVDIAADPAKVWQALTAEMHRWWLPDFRMAPGHQKIHLELRPGGRWYEDAGDQGGLVWGQVIAFETGVSLHLAGDIAPPWGAARVYMHLQLEPAGATTTLRVTNVMIGDVDEAAASSIESGWKLLFTDGLKRYVESA